MLYVGCRCAHGSVDLLSFPRQFCEAVKVPRLGDVGGPRRKIVAFDDGGEPRRTPEEATGLARRKSGKTRPLPVGGGAVGGLDHCHPIGTPAAPPTHP